MNLGSISMPFLDATDGGGGGGDVLADGQRGSGDSSSAPGFGGQGDGQAQAVDISDETLIRVKGQKDPVKYGDYIKGQFVPKSDYTRSQQAKAAELKAAQETLRDRETRLEAFQRQQQGNAAPQANPVNELIKSLETKSYISGAEAAGLVKQLWDGGITKLAGAITQRDEVIKLLYNRMMQIDKSVGGIRETNQSQSLQQRFAAVKAELNLPDDPQVDEFLQDVYYSHEGEDLDQEFPNMVRARWEAYQKLLRVSDQQRVQSARKGVLAPGGQRGGNATPSNQLRNRVAKMDAKQLADEMWPLLGGGNT